jgi:hypothetical protein
VSLPERQVPGGRMIFRLAKIPSPPQRALGAT